ncbi:MAG: DNA polymerase III subunit delta' [Eubacterium sp.]|nr:DNA polymerase III subunit delta' [Eubacterium sp.]
MRELEKFMGFDQVVGHEEIKAHLRNVVKSGNVSHAWIFGGDEGSGKNLLASLFAMDLLCESGGDDPCLTCPSCAKMLSGNHPDVIYVTHEKPGSIGVDDIRSQLVDTVDIRPYESAYKIYIIDEAEKLTPSAQNAMLKTIEEPPSYVVIILLAENPDILLPTIQSRCVTLSLKPVGDEQVKEYLMQNLHVPDYQAEIEASYAQGNVGKAIKAAESSEFMHMTQNAVRLMKASRRMDSLDLIDAMKFMASEKQSVYAYLEIFEMWFRDVLLFKATREIDNLVFKDEINAIKERASVSSYEGIETIIQAIGTAATRLRANVNFDLVMELLFLTIREN